MCGNIFTEEELAEFARQERRTLYGLRPLSRLYYLVWPKRIFEAVFPHKKGSAAYL